jgi:hypothetical protein
MTSASSAPAGSSGSDWLPDTIAVQSGRMTRSRLFCCQFVTNELPASPECHSIRPIRSPVVAFGQGRSSRDSSEVPNSRRGVRDQRTLRNVNRACDRTIARTSCAANAGGHALTAAVWPGRSAENSRALLWP